MYGSWTDVGERREDHGTHSPRRTKAAACSRALLRTGHTTGASYGRNERKQPVSINAELGLLPPLPAIGVEKRSTGAHGNKATRYDAGVDVT